LADQAALWPADSSTASWSDLSGDERVYALVADGRLVGAIYFDELSAEGVLVRALDTSPFDRYGCEERTLKLIGTSLVVLAVALSRRAGCDGMVGCQSKSNSLPFYEWLGFRRHRGLHVILYEDEANALVARYDAIRQAAVPGI